MQFTAFNFQKKMSLQFQVTSGFQVWQTKPMTTPVEITEDLMEGEVWRDSSRMSSLTKDGDQLTAAFFETGIALVARRRFVQEYFINFEIYVPKDEFSIGLLGNIDDDPTNDLKRRLAEMSLPNTLNKMDLYGPLLTCKKLA